MSSRSTWTAFAESTVHRSGAAYFAWSAQHYPEAQPPIGSKTQAFICRNIWKESTHLIGLSPGSWLPRPLQYKEKLAGCDLTLPRCAVQRNAYSFTFGFKEYKGHKSTWVKWTSPWWSTNVCSSNRLKIQRSGNGLVDGTRSF